MKKLFFLIIAAACIIASCSKNDRFDPGQFPADAFHKSIPAHVPVVVIPPDEDGDGDDTEELSSAIDNAEPGTLIKLLEGEYYVGYMELYGFHGSIIGAGSERTIITCKPPIATNSQFAKNQTPGWWRLIGGNILISGITFRTPDGFLADDVHYALGRDVYAMFMVNNYNDIYYHPEDPQKVVIKNCVLSGGTNSDMSQDPFWVTDHNIWQGIWIGPDYDLPKEGIDYPLTKGDYLITNCCFNHFLNGAEGCGLGEKTKMSVTFSKLTNCYAPLYFTANYNASIFVTSNSFSGSVFGADVLIEDIDFGWLPAVSIKPIKRSLYSITGNTFNTSAQISSILIWDTWIAINPEQRLPMLAIFKGNLFNLADGSTGISAINSQDAVVKNNRFTGSCETGILIDGASTDRNGTQLPNEVYAKNALVLGNNFSGLKTSSAAVVLGEKSMDCTVIGTGKEVVIDNGINNRITGMKNHNGGYHFGRSIRDNFWMMRSMGHK